jgi:hypothetical protein
MLPAPSVIVDPLFGVPVTLGRILNVTPDLEQSEAGGRMGAGLLGKRTTHAQLYRRSDQQVIGKLL